MRGQVIVAPGLAGSQSAVCVHLTPRPRRLPTAVPYRIYPTKTARWQKRRPGPRPAGIYIAVGHRQRPGVRRPAPERPLQFHGNGAKTAGLRRTAARRRGGRVDAGPPGSRGPDIPSSTAAGGRDTVCSRRSRIPGTERDRRRNTVPYDDQKYTT